MLGTILKPDAVRFARVLHPEEGDLIVCTVEFEYEGQPEELEIAYQPDGFGSMIVASLNAMGFPEQDTEYIADRILKDLT